MKQSDKAFDRLVKAAHARVRRSESRNLGQEEKARRAAWREAYAQRPSVTRAHHHTYAERHHVSVAPAYLPTSPTDARNARRQSRKKGISPALLAAIVVLGGK